jgi:RNA polymerase sigma-70 factor, ECF subfamily
MSIDITGEPCPQIEQLIEQIPQLRLRAQSLVRNAADADDVVQDALEKALRARSRLRPDSNLLAWLTTTMTNTYIDSWRHECSRRAIANQIHAPQGIVEDEPVSPWWRELSRADVERAVARLRPRFREVFVLYALRGMSYDQISKSLRLRPGTIATRLRRARLCLRDLMTADAAANGTTPILANVARGNAEPRATRHATPRRQHAA